MQRKEKRIQCCWGREIDRFPQRGREGRKEGAMEGGREGGRDRGNNCGVVLVVNIYYKYYYGRKDTEHIIMDNGWMMHNSFTSRRRRSNNIRNDFKALPRDT